MQNFKKKLIPYAGKIGRPIFYAAGFVLGKERAWKFRKKMQGIANASYHKKSKNNKHDMERLSRLAAEGKPLRLHFGCGPRILKDWINLDIFYEPDWQKYYKEDIYPQSEHGNRNDFYQIDITEGPLPLPDNSVDSVFHEDFLEHINQESAVLFLAETRRVLKPGGVHHINTPDLISSMKKNSDLSKGWNGVYRSEWERHGHLNIFTKEYLSEIAKLVGYSKVEFTSQNKSLTKIPKEIRPGDDRGQHEQIFCDLIK